MVSIGRGEPRHELLRSGFNLAVVHDPEMIVEATSAADVAAAVKFATQSGLPVAVMNTGHGASVATDGGLLIRTGRMGGVTVDPSRRWARVEAGASWRDVIEAAAPHGLAPLNGSSPHVGAVGYTLGGGVGLLARRFGFAADHVRAMEVVTADGRFRRVCAEAGSEADLFWALRGAGGNFGVVTAMEIDLFPVPVLLGGELCFAAEACEEVLATYARWAAEVPETMASSVMVLRYPDDPALPHQLGGRHITHVRVAYCGDDLSDGQAWLQMLRDIEGCVLDTVCAMPYREVGTIHHEPVETPVAAFDRNILLRDFDHDAAVMLGKHAGSSADPAFLVELRAWGGALARPPAVPNAVGGRDARFSLLAITDANHEHRAQRDSLLDAMRPWGTGKTFLNFSGVEDTSLDDVRRAYATADFDRLRRIKADYDPDNTFRVNLNIPPHSEP
jgi:FAD/FMN-containing dehydrogenase